MGRREELRAVLRALDATHWPGYLTQHSGLPGPRANLDPCWAVAAEADPATIDALIATGDEYLTLCAVVGLSGDGLRPHAADSRWRVREGVAARPAAERRSAGVRTLRQALGYCWSVAVAADPGPGLARFKELERSADPDIGWIVRENLKKTRLAKLT